MSNNSVETILARIEEKLDASQRNYEALNKRLYGNGQPGDIQKFDKRLDALDAWHSEWVGKQSLISIAFGSLCGFVTSWLHTHFGKP